MLVTYNVDTYRVLMISGYEDEVAGVNQIGFVYLKESHDTYFGYLGIIKDGSPLPPNTQEPNKQLPKGYLKIYFHEAELVVLLDTLRNERPVTVGFDTDKKWGSVGTDFGPVGEQEEPVVP